MKRRADRWKRFQDQPGIRELGVKPFYGVDGKLIDIKNDPRITLFTKRNILMKSRRSPEELDSAGGVGCALSHIAVWQWMIDNSQPLCLIMEDDAVVPDNFRDRVNTCIRNSLILQNPGKWSAWIMGGTWEDLSQIPGEFNADGIVRIGAFVCFHAYIMTLPMATRLVRDSLPIQGHIDNWMSVYAYMNDLTLVGSKKIKLAQDQVTKTDIQIEGDCILCSVPADFHKTHRLVSKLEWNVAVAIEVVFFGVLAYYCYEKFRR
jgi:GR25 family glycosyltransferase involved in LPS biosynthesis